MTAPLEKMTGTPDIERRERWGPDVLWVTETRPSG
jgi:hypothetical protein